MVMSQSELTSYYRPNLKRDKRVCPNCHFESNNKNTKNHNCHNCKLEWYKCRWHGYVIGEYDSSSHLCCEKCTQRECVLV